MAHDTSAFSDQDVRTIWQQASAQLQLNLSPAVFNTWIVSNPVTDIVPQESGRFLATITSPTAFHASNLKKNLEPTICSTLEEILKQPIDITYQVGTVSPSQKPQNQSKQAARSAPTPSHVQPGFEPIKQSISPQQNSEGDGQESLSPRVEELFSKHSLTSAIASRIDILARRIGLRTDYTFDTFAVSTSNEMAHAAATAVAKRPGVAYNPLFFYGGVGVGKTHLMHAVGNLLLKENTDQQIVYCTGEEFTNEIVSAIQTKKARLFKQKYRSADVLLIDDIQFIAGKNAVQEEFFHTFNALSKQNKQIILTSDRAPQEIALLEDRLRSRFQAGLMIDIGQPSFELRTAIVLVKAQAHSIPLSIEMAKHIASTVDSARRIEGLVTSIRSEVELKEREINDELIADVLKSEIALKKQPLLAKPTDIIKTVAKHFELKPSALRGKKRQKNIVHARHIAMFILKEDVGLPLVEIGRWFSNRDHTSVLHAVNKIQSQVIENQQLQRDVAQLRTILSSK